MRRTLSLMAAGKDCTEEIQNLNISFAENEDADDQLQRILAEINNRIIQSQAEKEALKRPRKESTEENKEFYQSMLKKLQIELEARTKKLKELEQFKKMYEKPVLAKNEGENEKQQGLEMSKLDIPYHEANNEQPPSATKDELLDLINQQKEEIENYTLQLQVLKDEIAQMKFDNNQLREESSQIEVLEERFMKQSKQYKDEMNDLKQKMQGDKHYQIV